SMSNASWAIRFVASHENVMVVLSGMSDEAQVEDNTSYMENFEPLTPGQIEMCLKAGDILRKEIAVPCTGCRYCTPTCPKHIAIPDYFAVYNTIRRFGQKAYGDVINYYNNLVQTHGAPTDCVKCGICEKRCPQHLPIRQHLEEVGAALNK
ncbi:MAG: 4Fe-4S dicluster domain-containing protein, partial [Lachnospiraceae bacterium]|nr:4Fe-4S dicluster domain-containing protein [Lachnospiraceae bacterium]